MNITEQNRRESFDIVLENLGYRQKQCVDCLAILKKATARELSTYMFNNKIINSPERNYTHPRLNELVELNVVNVIGKKKDETTNRTVAVYELGGAK